MICHRGPQSVLCYVRDPHSVDIFIYFLYRAERILSLLLVMFG